jgi:hypothetical protein
LLGDSTESTDPAAAAKRVNAMRTRLIALAILVPFEGAAVGQVRQFVFSHTDALQARQEIRIILTATTEIPAGVDEARAR